MWESLQGLLSLWRGNTANIIRYFPIPASTLLSVCLISPHLPLTIHDRGLLQDPLWFQEEWWLLDSVRWQCRIWCCCWGILIAPLFTPLTTLVHVLPMMKSLLRVGGNINSIVVGIIGGLYFGVHDSVSAWTCSPRLPLTDVLSESVVLVGYIQTLKGQLELHRGRIANTRRQVRSLNALWRYLPALQTRSRTCVSFSSFVNQAAIVGADIPRPLCPSIRIGFTCDLYQSFLRCRPLWGCLQIVKCRNVGHPSFTSADFQALVPISSSTFTSSLALNPTSPTRVAFSPSKSYQHTQTQSQGQRACAGGPGCALWSCCPTVRVVAVWGSLRAFDALFGAEAGFQFSNQQQWRTDFYSTYDLWPGGSRWRGNSTHAIAHGCPNWSVNVKMVGSGAFNMSLTAGKGVEVELEQVESTHHVYPATISFLKLLITLIHPPKQIPLQDLAVSNEQLNTVPENLGQPYCLPGISPFTLFVIDNVFCNIPNREYSRPSDRWQTNDLCLSYIERSLASFTLKSQVSGPDEETIDEHPTSINYSCLYRGRARRIWEQHCRWRTLSSALFFAFLRIVHRVLEIQDIFLDVFILLPSDHNKLQHLFFGRPSPFAIVLYPLWSSFNIWCPLHTRYRSIHVVSIIFRAGLTFCKDHLQALPWPSVIDVGYPDPGADCILAGFTRIMESHSANDVVEAEEYFGQNTSWCDKLGPYSWTIRTGYSSCSTRSYYPRYWEQLSIS